MKESALIFLSMSVHHRGKQRNNGLSCLLVNLAVVSGDHDGPKSFSVILVSFNWIHPFRQTSLFRLFDILPSMEWAPTLATQFEMTNSSRRGCRRNGNDSVVGLLYIRAFNDPCHHSYHGGRPYEADNAVGVNKTSKASSKAIDADSANKAILGQHDSPYVWGGYSK